ncbi:MAG: hypothetical protein OXI17_13850 [Gammaproteobacteria bacterium]|nr:hypothetical protein [Gammaproteobacteria bacterium]
MRRRAGNRLQRLADRQGRQRTDLVGVQSVYDFGRIALELDGILDIAPHACNDDLLDYVGAFGLLGESRGRGQQSRRA